METKFNIINYLQHYKKLELNPFLLSAAHFTNIPNILPKIKTKAFKVYINLIKDQKLIIGKKTYKLIDIPSNENAYPRNIIFKFYSLEFLNGFYMEYEDITNFLTYIEEIIDILIPSKKKIHTFNSLWYSDHIIALRIKNYTTLLYYLNYNYDKKPKKIHNIINNIFSLINFNLYLIQYTPLGRHYNNHALDQYYYGYKTILFLNLTDKKKYFKDNLLKEINFQFIEGVHRENTPAYHIDMMHRLKTILNELKGNFDKTELNIIKNIFQKACHFIINVMTPTNTLPGLGDEFENKIEIEDLINRGVYTDELIPENTLSIWEKPGYSIFRNENIYFLCKCSYNSYFHKHYDDSHFILFYKKIKFFTDAGKFNYEYKNINRAYVTHSNAHNIFSPLLKKAQDQETLFCDQLYGWADNIKAGERGSGAGSWADCRYPATLNKLDNTTIECQTAMYKNIDYIRRINIQHDTKIKRCNIVIKDRIGIRKISNQLELCSLLHVPNNIKCIKESNNSIILKHNSIKIRIQITSGDFNKYEIIKGLYKNQLVGYFSPCINTIEENQCIIFFFNDTKTLEYEIKIYFL